MGAARYSDGCGVKFDPNARLDTGQVDDARGRRMGTGAMAGGGGILVGLDQPAGSSGGTVDESGEQATRSCTTGADANSREDCRIVAVVNSVQGHWSDHFDGLGSQYVPARTRLFSGQTVTGGCGPASSASGPFYCPADQTVYIDLSFFDTLTRPPFTPPQLTGVSPRIRG